MRKTFVIITVATSVVHTLLLLALVRSESHFLGDDMIGFWLGCDRDFLDYLVTPIDIHLVPLHRLTTYVIYHVSPMSFDLALGVLLAFHLLGVGFLYATLQRLQSTPVNAVIVGLYGMHVFLGSLFMWWSSGLHRLPYIAFSVAAVYFYVGHRERPRLGSAAAVVACFALALGFYVKAVLIPLYLVAVELCVCRDEEPFTLRIRRARLPALLALLGAGFMLVWRSLGSEELTRFSWSADVHAAFLQGAAATLAESTLGLLHMFGSRWWMVAAALWSVLVVYTVVRGRRNARVWTACAGLVIVNLLSISLSHRGAFLGGLLAVADRYYFELAFIVALFTGIAIHRTTPGSLERRLATNRGVRGAATVVASAVVVVSMALSQLTFRGLVEWRYRDYSESKRYIDNLGVGLGRLARASAPPSLRGGYVPPYLVPGIDNERRLSILVRVMGSHVALHREGGLRVARDGRVVAAR